MKSWTNDIPRLSRNEAERIKATLLQHLNPDMMKPVYEVVFGAGYDLDGLADAESDRFVAITQSVAKVVGMMLGHHAEDILEDRVDPLESELMDTAQIAYNHGAEEIILLNFPTWKERLEEGKKLYLDGKSG